MAKRLLGLLGLLALLYAALCVLLFVFQGAFIYMPQARAPVHGTQMHVLKTEAGDVLVTTRPHPGAKAVVYFGGNAEDVGQSLPGLAQAFPEHAIYLLHYRGYGGSAGAPSEAALVADALQLMDQVEAAHAQVTVIGRSLGSGVAVQVAVQRPLARLVLVTPFHSMLELARERFPFVPVRWLLRDRYESWIYAPRIDVPTTIITAANDELIPRRSTDLLTAAFPPGVARQVVIGGAGHNDIGLSGQYLPALAGR
ncbi:MAG: lysophospholipase [Betaproteobacteria bacterium]|nr:lysophospholipase [Betaproteobacteria bacterium]MCL2886311.1 lysophospholipase [Betaproteobacteria bacterium]